MEVEYALIPGFELGKWQMVVKKQSRNEIWKVGCKFLYLNMI